MRERERGEQRGVRGWEGTAAPVQGPAVGTCLASPDEERGPERRRRLCGVWVGAAGFLQKSAPRVTLESCPSAPLFQGCGCGEDLENEEAALRQNLPGPPPAGRRSRDSWEVEDKGEREVGSLVRKI